MTPRIAIASLLLAPSAPASANVNLTGHFVGVIGSALEFGPFPCDSVHVVQSGTAIALKAGTAGKAKITLKGAGAGLGLPLTLASVSTPVVVQLKAENGSCWEADYPSALRNNPVEFRARGGSPGGAFLDD
jgi:hypothetical protein